VASVILGDAIFYTLALARQEQIPVSLDLLKQVLANILTIETSGDNIISVVFALIGAGVVIYQMRKPQFTPEFQRLGAPVP
jgi:hypothetical protein